MGFASAVRFNGHTKSAAHFLLFDHLIGAPLKSMKAAVPTGGENSYFS